MPSQQSISFPKTRFNNKSNLLFNVLNQFVLTGFEFQMELFSGTF